MKKKINVRYFYFNFKRYILKIKTTNAQKDLENINAEKDVQNAIYIVH